MLIIGPNSFISQSSSELIFHIMKSRDQTSNLLFVDHTPSWSISQILEHEFFCLGSNEDEKFEYFKATFEGGFFNLQEWSGVVCYENILNNFSELKSSFLLHFYCLLTVNGVTKKANIEEDRVVSYIVKVVVVLIIFCNLSYIK